MKQGWKKEIVKTSKKLRHKTLCILTLCIVISVGTLAMGEQREKKTTVYYESVQIHAGDTLWGIAKEYPLEGHRIEQRVKEIMRINGMSSENIKSGCSIIVPVVKV